MYIECDDFQVEQKIGDVIVMDKVILYNKYIILNTEINLSLHNNIIIGYQEIFNRSLCISYGEGKC